MSGNYVKKIVIVGGGTAGWLTASVIAADYLTAKKNGIEITLIESESIPSVGVGEGTWPSMRSTLSKIGVSESDILNRCKASFKQGSRFLRWFDGSPVDCYLHPFEAPPSEDEVDWHSLWKYGNKNFPYSSAVSVQNEVCSRNLAPKQINTPEYTGYTNYAYHLDASSFAEVLKQHCVLKLNVSHILGDVVDCQFDLNGNIHSLKLKNNESEIIGDFFIDCTGKKATLISKCGESTISNVTNTLFNNRALVIQVPYPEEGCEILSQTDSTAVEAGWIWDIALQNRKGIGYVYSSSHTSESKAYKTLSQYLNSRNNRSSQSLETARLLKYESQYRTKPWVRNIVAIGLSQGFVEPLEASAIVMIELAASYISKILPFSKDGLHIFANQFNQRFEYRWKRIVEFLKLHYVLSSRNEQYWIDHREKSSVPTELEILLKKWKFSAPAREDFTDALEIFTAASYAYVLYGMRFETLDHPFITKRNDPLKMENIRRKLVTQQEKLISSLPTNRDLLNFLSKK